MRRLIGAILLATFLGTGSGVLKYLHLMEHAAEQNHFAGLSLLAPHGDHDENNCQVCFVLATSMVVCGFVSLLICLGLILTRIRINAARPAPRYVPVWIEGRGPPVR